MLFVHSFHNWMAVRWREQEHQAQLEGQQISDGDRPLGRDRVVQWTVNAFQNFAFCQLGQESVHGLVEVQLGLFYQDHRRDCCDWLGHRRDPEDCVAANRLRTRSSDRCRTESIDVVFIVVADQRD